MKFNLNDLDQYTDSSITQHVTIKADTVYMTNTLTINFNLTIWARTILVSHPIKLVYDRNQHNLPRENGLVEQIIQINDQFKVRSRKYGLIQLMDELKNGEKSNTNCSNDQVNFIIAHLYDPTILNMMYLCCTALTKNGLIESQITEEVIDFVMRLYSERTKVKDIVSYINAQKYLGLKMKEGKAKFRHVPNTLQIKEWYNRMDKEWSNYSRNLNVQSEKLDLIKKDILEINYMANELENMLLEELESEKIFIFQLMEIMDQLDHSWRAYDRYSLAFYLTICQKSC